MTTGNLELRIGDERLYAFTEFEGYAVHDALGHLAAYEGSDHRAWFERTASELLMTIGDRLTMPDHRVVIDIYRRTVSSCCQRTARERLKERGYRIIRRRDAAFFRPAETEMETWIAELTRKI